MFSSKLCIVSLTLLLTLSEHSSQPGFPYCLMKDGESLSEDNEETNV